MDFSKTKLILILVIFANKILCSDLEKKTNISSNSKLTFEYIEIAKQYYNLGRQYYNLGKEGFNKSDNYEIAINNFKSFNYYCKKVYCNLTESEKKELNSLYAIANYCIGYIYFNSENKQDKAHKYLARAYKTGVLPPEYQLILFNQIKSTN